LSCTLSTSVSEAPPPADPAADPLRSDARWQLVQRVLDSATFERSKRLRDFLAYTALRSLRNPAAVLYEDEIAGAVFEHQGALDASTSSLVRVQASQVRKKLHQYFAAEGAQEPVVLELAMGTYAPVFRERNAVTDATDAPAAPRRLAPPRWLWPTTSAVLLVACAGLWVQNRSLRAAPEAPRSAVDRLWTQMFGGGKRTLVVLADSSFTMLQNLIRLQLPPGRYGQEQLRELVDERIADPALRQQAFVYTRQRYTSMADVALTRRVLLLNARHAITTDVVLARDIGPQDLGAGHLILSGPRRGNPWIELFEERLNFRSHYDLDKGQSRFENHAPQPGERPTYDVLWDRVGYCRVAYLPSLSGGSGGNVLLVSGTDMSSGEAGIEFITAEGHVADLLQRLHITSDGPIPYFEVLLRARVVAAAASSPELVALRTK